jgi:hypothetical protein
MSFSHELYDDDVESSKANIQALFNEYFAPLIEKGHLKIYLKSSKPVETDFLPIGSKSNIFNILNQDGKRIAVAHIYVDAQGNHIGKLDPKALIFDRTLYTFYGESG